MCGRYTYADMDPEMIRDYFLLSDAPALPPMYNIAPTQYAPVIIYDRDLDIRGLTLMRWGLIPSWAKDMDIGNRLINAKAETVHEKPSFRAGLKYRRCLIPADGFYEWRRIGDKKQPIRIVPANGGPMALAGIWETWRSPDASEIQSYTILTTSANSYMKDIHDRQPVVIQPDDFDLWLDPAVQKADEIRRLLSPIYDDFFHAYPVSTLVNSAKNNLPDCILPLDTI